MNPRDLALLSQAHAVAMTAMVAPETRSVPLDDSRDLLDAATLCLPDFAPTCARFVDALRDSRGHLDRVSAAGRALRDAVSSRLAFVPCDAGRVDIHG